MADMRGELRTAPSQLNNACHTMKAAADQIDALVKALEFIRDGYDNHDVSHRDYRVKAYQAAVDALATADVGKVQVP